MKKILYATDFSENATKAFDFALEIARKYDAELIMLHVFAIPHASWEYPNPYTAQEMERRAVSDFQTNLKAFFDESTGGRKVGLKVDFLAIENISAVDGIMSVVQESEPDLVVMGTKGGSKIQNLLFGSTTKKLIRDSPSPILAIPETAVFNGFNKILFTIDFCDEDLDALSKWTQVFQPYNTEFTLMHIDTQIDKPDNEKMEQFKNLVERNVPYQKVKFHMLFADTLQDYDSLSFFLQQNDFDILLMYVKPREGFMDNIFHHDMVKKMESRTPIPLLSYNKFCVDKWNEGVNNLAGK